MSLGDDQYGNMKSIGKNASVGLSGASYGGASASATSVSRYVILLYFYMFYFCLSIYVILSFSGVNDSPLFTIYESI